MNDLLREIRDASWTSNTEAAKLIAQKMTEGGMQYLQELAQAVWDNKDFKFPNGDYAKEYLRDVINDAAYFVDRNDPRYAELQKEFADTLGKDVTKGILGGDDVFLNAYNNIRTDWQTNTEEGRAALAKELEEEQARQYRAAEAKARKAAEKENQAAQKKYETDSRMSQWQDYVTNQAVPTVDKTHLSGDENWSKWVSQNLKPYDEKTFTDYKDEATGATVSHNGLQPYNSKEEYDYMSGWLANRMKELANTSSNNVRDPGALYNQALSDYYDMRKGIYDSFTVDQYTPPENQPANGVGTSNDPGDVQKGDEGVMAGAADLQQAIAQGAQAAQKEAQDSARAGAMAGINKQRAGMLGSQGSEQSQTSNAISGYAANQQQRGATQADYLQKMAQADALDQQAANMKKGAAWNTASAAMGGAAGGAAVGATMGLSDERAKQAPDGIDDDELNKAIKQFRELYNKLKSLKEKR